MILLGIDTSCDDTSAACIKNDKVLSNIVFSQLFHSKYGGVMPELAARDHIKNISTIVQNAVKPVGLDKLDAIAVTYGPGLIGSLLVGLSFAKSLSASLKIPLYAVNHIEGHIFSLFINNNIKSQFLCLVVSGGHTELVLVKKGGDKYSKKLSYKTIGSTVDDAAGEAFDKVARMLGLGYPGGKAVEILAKKGNKKAVNFPRTDLKNYNFSFSGIKTAVLYYLKKNPQAKSEDVAASFQEAVVDSLVNQTLKAAAKLEVNNIGVVGGVIKNNRLRQKFTETAELNKIKVFFPKHEFSTDNAAMVALCARHHLENGKISPLTVRASSRAPLIDN